MKLNKEELTEEYLRYHRSELQKSINQISIETGWSRAALRDRFKKYNIPEPTTKFDILTKEFLYDEFINKRKQIKKISAETEINTATIGRKLREYGIIKKNRCEVGVKIGSLLIQHTFIENNRRRCVCLCDCGNTTTVDAGNLRLHHTTRCKECKFAQMKAKGNANTNWKGYQEISGHQWCQIQRCAKRRTKGELEFNITIVFAWDLYIKQDRKCALSGLPISFCDPAQFRDNTVITASLDRIDSSRGYTEDNVQWVHKDVNQMKRDYSDEYFIFLCKNVAVNRSEV